MSDDEIDERTKRTIEAYARGHAISQFSVECRGPKLILKPIRPKLRLVVNNTKANPV